MRKIWIYLVSVLIFSSLVIGVSNVNLNKFILNSNDILETTIEPGSSGVGEYVYFYKYGKDELVDIKSLGCDIICYETKILSYNIPKYWDGNYYLAIYDYEIKDYIKKEFSVNKLSEEIVSTLQADQIIVETPNEVNLGEEFYVNININTENFYGGEIELSFNSNLLDVVSVEEGIFVGSDGVDTLFISEDIVDKVNVSVVRTKLQTINGSGNLFVVRFRAINTGINNFILKGDVFDSNKNVIPLIKVNNSTTIFSVLQRNSKDNSKYLNKEVFLISDNDTNWRSVLSLVPVTIWTYENDSVGKHPLLVYHVEYQGLSSYFDADSVIHFMQQYNPSRVTIVGSTPTELDNLLIADKPLGAGLTSDQIQRISIDDSFSYWNDINEIMVLDYNNYEEGLMASVYASLFNMPILFLSSLNLDRYKNLIDGKDIKIVGSLDFTTLDYINLNARTVETFSLNQIQQIYINKTNTKKFILTNPSDFNMYVTENFAPDKSSYLVRQLYGKTSLIAPIFGAGFHALILPVHNTTYEEVDSEFTSNYMGLMGLSDVDRKVCNLNDACADVYRKRFDLNYIDSGGITFTYPIPKSNISYANFNVDVYEQDGAFRFDQNCSSVSYELSIGSYIQRGFLLLYNDSTHFTSYRRLESIRIDNPSVIPTTGDTFQLTFNVTNCGLIKVNQIPAVLYYSLTNGSKQVAIPLADSANVVNNVTIYLDGIEIGYNSTFTFSNLDNLDYHITIPLLYPSYEDNIIGPFVNGVEKDWVSKDDVANGDVEIVYGTIDRFIPLSYIRLVSGYQNDDYYLIIFGSPDAIQMSTKLNISDDPRWYAQVDSYYGVLDTSFYHFVRAPYSEDMQGLIHGRIFGISSSDVSAYVARDLFFDQIPKSRNAMFLMRGVQDYYTADHIIWKLNEEATWDGIIMGYDNLNFDNIKNEFDNTFECYSYNDSIFGCDTLLQDVKDNYPNYYSVLYDDHGTHTWALLSSSDLNGMYLEPGIAETYACLTCSYDYVRTFNNTGYLFCARNLRAGRLGYIGSVSIAWVPEFMSLRYWVPIFYDNYTLGQGYKRQGYNSYFNIFGDPSFKPKWWSE